MADYGWTIVKVAVAASQMRHKFTIVLTSYYGYQVSPCYNLSVEAFAQEQLDGDYKDVVVAMMKYGDSVDAIASSAEPTLADKIIRTAKKYLGVPYLYGGEDPTGFDCSGYMQYAFSAHGVTIPRTSGSQSQYGNAVSRSDLEPGDLLFFDTTGNGQVNHVGLYIGDGYFIHASTKRGMEIADLYDGYWLYHYLNARRVL
jgi:cell wall-associated NlpC family hydrolase